MTGTVRPGPRSAAARAGLTRGWIETRQSFTEPAHIVGYVIPAAGYAAVLYALRAKTMPGTDVPLVVMMLAGFLTMSIVFGGLSSPVTGITADREDGTLLRAKATPHGMLGYLVGKIVMFAVTTYFGLVSTLVLGLILVDGLGLDARAWLWLTAIFVAGMVATVPLGVALGAVMRSSLQALLVPIASLLIMGASGVFLPGVFLPAWLQGLVQAFPFYWVGLGVRAAILPADMAAAEIGQSWRTLEMFAVLGAWAAIGFVLAPILLRRMARRQSGSALAEVHHRIMARGY